MGKIAFVFSGQGDQHPGMGREWCERYPAAAAVFSMCDRVRPGTSAQCFEGTEEELKDTKNTQPCLFAVELAAASVLLEKGIVPDAAAGFSLGEVAAAAVSGILDRETAFRLVCRRGELMQREAEKFYTAMAAVVKLGPEQVQDICARHTGVYPVNFNCPGQITVSGLASQMADFSADVKTADGMGLVTAKLRETTTHVISMSVLILDLRKNQCAFWHLLMYLLAILPPKKKLAIVQ